MAHLIINSFPYVRFHDIYYLHIKHIIFKECIKMSLSNSTYVIINLLSAGRCSITESLSAKSNGAECAICVLVWAVSASYSADCCEQHFVGFKNFSLSHEVTRLPLYFLIRVKDFPYYEHIISKISYFVSTLHDPIKLMLNFLRIFI